MKSIKKIAVVATLAVIALLATSCGDKNEQPDFFGYGGQPCGSMVNGFSGYNSFNYAGSNPNMGNFLNANPNSVFRYGNECYNGHQVQQMYQQYGMPWNQFQYSPYANFEMYYPQQQNATGSYSYNRNEAYNTNWVGAGDFFGGNPFMRRPRNQWSLYFNYYKK